MKLDRNTNADGKGKYALVNLRKARALAGDDLKRFQFALAELADLGVATFGNESPGDQFFVMKYKDMFTAPALAAYANAAYDYAIGNEAPVADGIVEFSKEVLAESVKARALNTWQVPT